MRLSPLIPRKYIVLNRNFVFDLRDFDSREVFQESKPGVKRELPVLLSVLSLQDELLSAGELLHLYSPVPVS
jgi:hypothetical protein